MTAAAFIAWLWSAAGGYIVSALGGAAAVVWFWVKSRGRAAQAKKIEHAEKRGEETAVLEKRLGEAAQTAATVDSAKRGVNAQSDDRLADIAASRWLRK